MCLNASLDASSRGLWSGGWQLTAGDGWDCWLEQQLCSCVHCLDDSDCDEFAWATLSQSLKSVTDLRLLLLTQTLSSALCAGVKAGPDRKQTPPALMLIYKCDLAGKQRHRSFASRCASMSQTDLMRHPAVVGLRHLRRSPVCLQHKALHLDEHHLQWVQVCAIISIHSVGVQPIDMAKMCVCRCVCRTAHIWMQATSRDCGCSALKAGGSAVDICMPLQAVL